MFDALGKEGLQFFGAMTASISHEINNRMAIINEQAGLLEDLVLMSRKGSDMNIDRLERLAESVKNQIRLAEAIIQTMNRFAHSIDTFTLRTDLNEVIALSVRLFRRTANNREIQLVEAPSDNPVFITTSPYLLMNLLWRCLGAFMGSAGKNALMKIGSTATPEGAEIRLIREMQADGAATIELSDAATSIGEALKASVAIQNDGNAILLSLPAAL